MKSKLLGRLGVWLCDRYYPRPSTSAEQALNSQYVRLVIDVLRGECTDYGRDRAKDTIPLIADRRDYDMIYQRREALGGKK
jgi:hypothetical protein